MKTVTFLVTILFLFSSVSFSQTLTPEVAIPSGFNSVENPFIPGGDNIISQHQPLGPIAIIEKQSPKTMFCAINDTLSTSNLGIVLYMSTNDGQNWGLYTYGINLRQKFERFRLVRSGLDSVYLVFMNNSRVYIWNIYNTSGIASHDSTNIRAFDIVASSTGALYLYTDHLGTNNIRRFGTITGGFTWAQAGYVTSAGAFPTMYMSGTGDTLFMNYYGTPFGSDTTTAKIRVARYRETSPGFLSSAGFQDLTTDPQPKHQFGSAAYKGVVWFFYTLGTTGNIDIKCRVSQNAGTSYGSVFNVAANPNVDEYWFDAKHFILTEGGIDFCFYSDSLQSGPPTNSTDKLITMFSQYSSPLNFTVWPTPPPYISNHPPGWSAAGYVPQVVEIYSDSSYGFAWVGYDGPSNWRVYFDANNLVTSLSNNGNTPGTYELYQNYPNPFNPVTKINFDIPKSGFVTLKVYDMLGKEVQTLVSRDLTTGSYSVDFDASKLTSGAYFYKLITDRYVGVKKMVLIK